MVKISLKHVKHEAKKTFKKMYCLISLNIVGNYEFQYCDVVAMLRYF